ncbi:MAG TPA: cyclic nucleotide-binding domain-containing protein [Planctomycetota bacterium]|nr:cyclic nucleotide-binding domain-containing protein [Planctomycetota bacterium]
MRETPGAPDLDALRRISLFGALSLDEVGLVRGLMEERSFEPGALLVREGTPGRELYVLESGHCEVLKHNSDDRDVKIAELAAGAVFGEMALIGILPRSATVRALSPVKALVLPYQKVTALSKEHLQTFTILVMNLARDICRRLYQADALLGEFNIDRGEGGKGDDGE